MIGQVVVSLEPAPDGVVNQLVQELGQLRETGQLRKRGGERGCARGAGAKGEPTAAGRFLATVRRLGELGTRDLLTQLIGVDGSTVTWAARQVQPLLARRRLHHSPLDRLVPHSRWLYSCPGNSLRRVFGTRCGDICMTNS